MRMFHLSDLHIGKQLCRYNLKEDQTYILNQIVEYVRQYQPQVVMVAGDVYDKQIPSAEAITIFDEFLTELARIEPKVTILIIAGNHDSAQRLDYAKELLQHMDIHIVGRPPQNPEQFIKRVTRDDEYGKVDFYLLPFTKPGYVRNVFPGEELSYSDAVCRLIKREKIDESRRNVILSHQFYTGGSTKIERADSELITVGGIDNVDASILLPFEYAALGHIHGAQSILKEGIRYGGTPLKYSVSEAKQKKVLTMIELEEKGKEAKLTFLPMTPLREVRREEGTLEEILQQVKEGRTEDYISVLLKDEKDPYMPKEQLERVYSHILEIQIDNERTRRKLLFEEQEEYSEDPLEIFSQFYKEIQGQELENQELEIVKEIIDKAKEEKA